MVAKHILLVSKWPFFGEKGAFFKACVVNKIPKTEYWGLGGGCLSKKIKILVGFFCDRANDITANFERLSNC